VLMKETPPPFQISVTYGEYLTKGTGFETGLYSKKHNTWSLLLLLSLMKELVSDPPGGWSQTATWFRLERKGL